jgi:hypothetical protein
VTRSIGDFDVSWAGDFVQAKRKSKPRHVYEYNVSDDRRSIELSIGRRRGSSKDRRTRCMTFNTSRAMRAKLPSSFSAKNMARRLPDQVRPQLLRFNSPPALAILAPAAIYPPGCRG